MGIEIIIFSIVLLLSAVLYALYIFQDYFEEKRQSKQSRISNYEPKIYECLDMKSPPHSKVVLLKRFESLFVKNYNMLLSTAKKSVFNTNAEFESLIPIYFICDYATSTMPEEKRLEILDKAYDLLFEIYPNLDSSKLSERLNMYEKTIQEKSVRCLWAFGNRSFLNDDIPSNCAAIWGDIICNPKCADDYINAPIIIHDAFILMRFQKTIVFVNEILVNFFKSITEKVILPLKALD